MSMGMSKSFALAAAVWMASSLALAGETAESVEILRDVHGVPHVFASTDEGAMFGAGYAAATDRLYQMHRTRRSVQGRLSELVGNQVSAQGSTLDQDRSFRVRRFYDHCETVAANLDARTRSLLEAYAAGVNQYVADHAPDLHPLFDGQVPEPWVPADSIACWDRVGEYFSGSVPTKEPGRLHDIEAAGSCEEYWNTNPNPVVIDEGAAVVQMSDIPPETLDELCAFASANGYPCPSSASTAAPGPARGAFGVPTTIDDGPLPASRLHATDTTYPKFSHAWVVGGSALRGGSSAVHSDPQTKVFAPSFGHEMHVVGETFDVRGLTFPGSPGFLIGSTPDVAWGVTAMGLDQEDTFRLDTSPGGWGYRYDGQWKLISSRYEMIRVRTESGFDEVPLWVRWTEIGPIVNSLLEDVEPGEHYALAALPLVDRDRHTIQATLAMMSATNAAEFAEAASGWRSPSVHCVYGDSNGAVGYAALAAVPVRAAGSCLGGTGSQDGSLSSQAWQGFIPAELMPQIRLPEGGTLFSANHIPVGSWYPIPLHLGTGGSGDSARSWRLRELLTLPAGAGPHTAIDVLEARDNDVNPVRRDIVRTALFLRGQVPTIFSGAANRTLDRLEPWLAAGAHSSLDEPDFALAWHLDTNFRGDDWPQLVPLWGSNNLIHMLKDFGHRIEANPDAPAEFSLDEIAFLDNALSAAWREVRMLYGGDPEEWQSALAAELGSLRVRYFGSLAGFGSVDPGLDVTVTGFTRPDPKTLGNQRSQSYTLFSHLAPNGQRVGLHPIGESEHADSPYFDVSSEAWAAGQLRDAGLDVAPQDTVETTVLTWNGL